MDYCNVLLYNIPKYQLNRLQRIQNNAARLVCKKNIYEHVTPLFWSLHWLPIEYRIKYKIATLCYKTLNNNTPHYISELINLYTPPRSLRSENQMLLSVPKKRSKRYAERTFIHGAPNVWNALPLHIKNCESEGVFKS